MKRSSASSPICRLPSQRSPAHVATLCFFWVLSTAGLFGTAAPIWLIATLSTASACYCGLCIKAVLTAGPFSLHWQADGRLDIETPHALARIDAPVWHDYGYLIVLQTGTHGIPPAMHWWLPAMKPEARRALRRMMDVSSALKLEKPPSLIVNPLL